MRDRYLFDVQQIEEKCYLLLTCFAASEHIHDFSETLADLGIPHLSVFEPRVVTTYLISVAVQLRMIDDAMRSHGRTHHVPDFFVGLLNEAGQEKELDVREACNKIIHARNVKVVEITATGAECLTKTIFLSGTKGSSSWNSEIHIELFLKAALFMANRYDEDWDVSALR